MLLICGSKGSVRKRSVIKLRKKLKGGLSCRIVGNIAILGGWDGGALMLTSSFLHANIQNTLLYEAQF